MGATKWLKPSDSGLRIGDSMCVLAASRCSVSIEQVKAITEVAWLHAYGHAGIVDRSRRSRSTSASGAASLQLERVTYSSSKLATKNANIDATKKVATIANSNESISQVPPLRARSKHVNSY